MEVVGEQPIQVPIGGSLPFQTLDAAPARPFEHRTLQHNESLKIFENYRESGQVTLTLVYARLILIMVLLSRAVSRYSRHWTLSLRVTQTGTSRRYSMGRLVECCFWLMGRLSKIFA